MWKKRISYSVILVVFLRLGWSLYSMMPSVFSKGSFYSQSYVASLVHYEQEFKKALENDVDTSVNVNGSHSISELDKYIGLLLTEKEKKYPGFIDRNKAAIEVVREAVIEYVRVYTTFCNQRLSDVGPKESKREIQCCIRKNGNEKIKPLLDQLIYEQEEEVP